ncbi:MAG: hemerythrin [Acidobacteria bacterium]|nr:MAG: hemerythrin [Acidobacteriota bacterium]
MPTKKRARSADDAISLLKKDHEKVRGLLKKLESAADRGDDRAQDLLAQVDREVKIHSQVEEEIFYPAFHEAARTKEENKLFFEAKEEHHVVDMVMPEVSDSAGGREDFAARTKVLKDLIEHHADEEEKQMFPRAKKLFGREELRELGRRIKERKEELGAE